jgi:hypothetical protein
MWAEYPGNVTNLTDVLANGDPPDIRARPTWAAPAAHADNAAAAIVAKYKEAVLKHQAFNQASSALAKALLVSIGDENQTHLRTTFVNVKIYALTPAQIVTTMIAKHGVATGDDIQRLKEPLSQALLSLSDFERHMGKYLLASQKLTRAGQGLTDYAYFQAFLLTVQDFPAMTQSMSLYYAKYPTVGQKSLATLFPFLTEQKEFILQQSASSLFSGAATPAPAPAKTPNNPKNKGKNKGRGKGNKQQKQHGRVKWGPQGPIALSAVPEIDPLAAAYHEIGRLQGMMAGYMGTSPAQGASEELPVYSPPYPNSTLNADSRPRQYYCWLHGYNNSHNGSDCRVMATNGEYTAAMRAARSSTGTGGNPNVGVPVHFTRFPKSFFRLHCAPCPPPPPTFSPPTPSPS